MSLLATPFHARAAAANRDNVWETRAGFTLATSYSSIAEEAVAAHFGAVLGDISWHWRATFSGGEIEAFMARAFTRNGAALDIGHGIEVLWLNDSGAVRGRGALLRLAADRFVLLSEQEDRDWLFYAAGLYGVACGDQSTDGMLALIGSTARKILTVAGIEAEPPPFGVVAFAWRGVDIQIYRLGLGYALTCDSDDAWGVWDRLTAAGRVFALLPAGQAALDILAFENGILTPGRDFAPARDGFAPEPTPQALGLCSLVDRSHSFNGKAGFLAAGRDTVLSGLLLDAETPPQSITHRGTLIGKIVATRTSPALKRLLGVGILSGSWPTGELETGGQPCRVVPLPFLPIGLSPQTTEGAIRPV